MLQLVPIASRHCASRRPRRFVVVVVQRLDHRLVSLLAPRVLVADLDVGQLVVAVYSPYHPVEPLLVSAHKLVLGHIWVVRFREGAPAHLNAPAVNVYFAFAPCLSFSLLLRFLASTLSRGLNPREGNVLRRCLEFTALLSNRPLSKLPSRDALSDGGCLNII